MQGEVHPQSPAPERAPGSERQQPAKTGGASCGDSREEVGGITGLRETLPPVDHKPGQGLQQVILHLDLVPICPCFHGNQHNSCVELFLVYLGPERRWEGRGAGGRCDLYSQEMGGASD